MEAYITQCEYDHVLKELKRVQDFLTDTFGSKFADYRCKDDVIEVGRVLGNECRNQLNGTKGNPNKDPISIDPLENQGPIVTSTKSLRPNVPCSPSISSPSETVPVSIIHSNKVSISVIPPVTASLPKPVNQSVQRNGGCHMKRIGQFESVQSIANQGNGSHAGENDNFETPKQVLQSAPPRIPQPVTQIKKKKAVPAPGEFQLRGRVFFHRPPSSSNDTSTSKANDSMPIPIGIETMEGVASPSPPKRSRPPPLPSFRNRSLGLQSTKQSSAKPTTAIGTSSVTSTSNNEIIQCDLCNLFIYSSQLDSHMKNHSLVEGVNINEQNAALMKKVQICPICSIKCIDFQMYEKHCADSHPEQGFPCPICSRRMSSKSKLKRHMMTIHRNLKFECNICGKAYNRNDNLSAHYKTHGNNEQVTVFYCPSCNTAFSSRTGRDKHVTSAHPDYQPLYDNDTPSDYDYDSSENETNCLNAKSIVTTEEIKIDDSAMSLQFEYEGDDD